MWFDAEVISLGFEYIIIGMLININKSLRIFLKSLLVIYPGLLSCLGLGWLLRCEFSIIIYKNGGWIYGELLFV
jgi:hypothetical protein